MWRRHVDSGMIHETKVCRAAVKALAANIASKAPPSTEILVSAHVKRFA